MKFNEHSRLVGEHAFLSASNYHWINYDEEKLAERYRTSQLAARGTQLHELAAQLIRMGIKMPRNQQTFNAYVNDAIGYKMVPEQVLFYSVNCFGTPDTISFRNGKLRIHDLKTGTTKASVRQPEVYAALFCLEYKFKPHQLDIELRLYQSDEIVIHVPELDDIVRIMDRIRTFDKMIESFKEASL